jgi:hypothetical protein
MANGNNLDNRVPPDILNAASKILRFLDAAERDYKKVLKEKSNENKIIKGETANED